MGPSCNTKGSKAPGALCPDTNGLDRCPTASRVQQALPHPHPRLSPLGSMITIASHADIVHHWYHVWDQTRHNRLSRPLSHQTSSNHSLRIDNCWRSVVCAFGRFSVTKLCKEIWCTSNKRAFFLQSYDISDILWKLSLRKIWI